MKNHITAIGLSIAVTLFIVSFLLPAFEYEEGYFYAVACMVIFIPTFDVYDLWPRIYWFLFTFSNLIMLLLPILLVTRWRYKKIPIGIRILQLILLCHVISWPIIAFFGEFLDMIHTGYYVWLLSMIIMAVVTFTKKDAGQQEKPMTIPSVHT
jgi:hypothetical protein